MLSHWDCLIGTYVRSTKQYSGVDLLHMRSAKQLSWSIW